MAESIASIAISNDIIAPILEAKIQAVIVEALGGQRELLEKTVTATLLTHRDRDGKPCRRGEYGDVGSFLESTARKYIEESTRAALAQYFDSRKAEITKLIERELKKETPALVEAFFGGLKAAAGSSYSMHVGFTIKPRER